jgi:hypothetical protein
MNREDLTKLVGAEGNGTEYLPVAFLLANGYACAGYYHWAVNEGLIGTCVLLNAHLIALQGDGQATGRPSIGDFNDFLEEIVVTFCGPSGEGHALAPSDLYGKSIPLAAIPYDQIAVVYPVAHIGALMRRAEQQAKQLPTFLDLNKSEIIGLLKTKLW